MTVSTSDVTENFLSKLKHVKSTGDGAWSAACPCRSDDDNPSLSVGQGRDGRVLVTCHRGVPCSLEEICTAVDIEVHDLYPKKERPVKQEKDRLTLTATYEYYDANGVLLFQKQRFVNQDGKKTFRQRRPDGAGGWSWSLGDTPKVLYNLPAVAQAVEAGETVYVVEGEKDADELIKLGYCATTMPGGAGKWKPIHTDALAGAKVEVLADNDEVGVKHAWEVFDALSEADCSVRVWRMPQGKDVAEYLGLGGDLKQVVRLERDSDQDGMIEHEIEDIEVGESPMDDLVDQISEVLLRGGLSDAQRLAKASMLLNAAGGSSNAPTGRLVNWQEFLDEDVDDSYDWVIPDLLERQERVIIVASEGVGKTMLARQVAICSAAGLHPFTMQRMKPITTLTIDLENPERIIRRTSNMIMKNAIKHGHSEKVKAHLVIQPSGLDLLRSSDRNFIEKHIEEVKPDLICIGPLYKSFIDPGGRTSESVAIEVAKYLDTIRDGYGCALWMEHHAPLGSTIATRDLRPFGSAVWSRWPEFGLSLTPDPTAYEGYTYDVKHFRGERDVRMFPTKMKRGSVFPFDVLEFRKVT